MTLFGFAPGSPGLETLDARIVDDVEKRVNNEQRRRNGKAFDPTIFAEKSDARELLDQILDDLGGVPRFY